MTGSTVDGALDLTARARQHRPADRATLRAAARELASRGLTPIDIAAALGLSCAAVRNLIEVPHV
ncbi:MAG: hypothetical protein M0038_16660 [Pseudomonadota bacterium]|jgi:hypothetical protein|nr:hypothetical protein [Pseudomonadota bacterium]